MTFTSFPINVEVDWRNSLADRPVWVPVQLQYLIGTDYGSGVITGIPDPPGHWSAKVGVRVQFPIHGPYIREVKL